MHVKQIRLVNYRSFENLSVKFENKLNYICGPNASGKTNLIEGIYYLALGRSFKKARDKNLIKEGENLAQVLVEYESKGETHSLRADISPSSKVIYLDDTKQTSVTKIVGKIQCVVYTPGSVMLFKNEPSERRKLIDSSLSSLSSRYLYALVRHKKILRERNVALSSGYDENVIDVLTEELINISFLIYDQRSKFIKVLNQTIGEIYSQLFGLKQEVKLEYVTNVPKINEQETFKSELRKYYNSVKTEERMRKTTLIGTQRDDLKAFIDDKSVFAYASQGQSRLLVLALKVAIAEIIEKKIGERPIMLLDDVLSDLDEERRLNILAYLKDKGQVFITSADNFEKVSNGDIYQIINNQVKRS